MPQLDFQTVGIAVVAMFLIGEKLFGLLRHMRSRDKEFEPKHNPELWKIYALKEETDKRFEALQNEIKELEKEERESRRTIYEQIRGVREDVASLGSKTEMICRQSTQIETKLDRVIENHHSS